MGNNGNGAFSLMILALPLLLLGWMFWSSSKRQKALRAFSSSLHVGDEVVTSSGIFGTIKHIDDTSAWLEVSEGTTIRFDRRALAMKQADEARTSQQATSGVRDDEETRESSENGQ